MIDAERERKRQAAETMAELEAAGVQIDQVPAEEVEEGGGEVMTVLTMWVRTLQRLRNPETSSQGMYVYRHTYVPVPKVCMCIDIRMSVCMYVCMYVCMCVFVCLCVCGGGGADTCTHKNTHTNTQGQSSAQTISIQF
jgi:hypothetical protein